MKPHGTDGAAAVDGVEASPAPQGDIAVEDLDALRRHFDVLTGGALDMIRAQEALTCQLTAEDTQFIRLNGARVRQAGHVSDAALRLQLHARSAAGVRTGAASLSLRMDANDAARVMQALEDLRVDVAALPPDPHAVWPDHHGSIEQQTRGVLPHAHGLYDELMPIFAGLDLAGLFASGPVVRATANSAGQVQWFASESFTFDYSVYTPAERAVKSIVAGTQWDNERVANDVRQSRALLRALERPPVRIARGEHRAYLAPAAVADLIAMFSWGAVGERAIQTGESPLRLVRNHARTLSPLFSLEEDFGFGLTPRFTGEGHVAPERLPIISQGELVGSLVHARTSLEFGVKANGAAAHEGLRAPAMATGTLHHEDALSALGTGVFLSNLHYLNWSDPFEGRVTGMTRYACLWVEDGVPVGPIETMRWDDSLFRLFGSELLDVGAERVLIPETSTYGNREPGGVRVPGMLVRGMNFTL